MTVAGYVSRDGMLRQGSRGDGVKALQQALLAHGHQLVVDGDFGPITIAAVKMFQTRHGLVPDGIVGPITAAALDGPVPDRVEPPSLTPVRAAPWLLLARALTGTKEIPGGMSNPVILGWVDKIVKTYPELKATVGWYSSDIIPWCGLFTGYCLVETGHRPPITMLRARSWWDSWAEGVKLNGPALGAILVKTRQGGGHVAFYEGEDSRYYFVRGGNQSDQVCVAKVVKNNEVLGFVWPSAYPLPEGGPVYTTFADAVIASEA